MERSESMPKTTQDLTPAEYLELLDGAHGFTDWLLAEYMYEHRYKPDSLPSQIGVIDLLSWSLRKRSELRRTVSA
jgi:hypothetical protein